MEPRGFLSELVTIFVRWLQTHPRTLSVVCLVLTSKSPPALVRAEGNDVRSRPRTDTPSEPPPPHGAATEPLPSKGTLVKSV